MEINAVGGIKSHIQPQRPTSHKPDNFAALINHYVQNTNMEVKAADKAAVGLAMGENSDVSGTLLAVQKADLSFQLMLSARNKLVDAYREVMRMSV